MAPRTWRWCATSPAMPERIEAVLQLRELGRSITTISSGEPRGPQDRRRTSDARPRTYADIDPAEIFGGGGDRVSEGEKLDLDCAECGTQAAQFSWAQILGEGLLRFDRRAGRGDDPRLHQKSGDRGQAVGSVAAEARVLIKSRLLYQNPS